MAWPKKKHDPISARARALNAEIAALESRIKKLDSQLQRAPAPRLRSTAMPHAAMTTHTATATIPSTSPREPIFEEVDHDRLRNRSDSTNTPEHFNDLGVRKYDLPALLGRIRNHLRGPSTTNPKLVSYLAAGGIQGLRPMRYEKRVARNRFIVLFVFLFLMLVGIIAVFVRNR
jgi:hypothetical protein